MRLLGFVAVCVEKPRKNLKKLDSSGRRDGKQAQTTPEFNSITDQQEAPTLVQVKSVVLAACLRNSMRTIDNEQVLGAELAWNTSPKGVWGYTYKNPRQNTPIKTAFCFMDKFNELKTGRGSVNTTISVAILTAALVYQTASRSTHFPVIEVFQNAATGKQVKIAVNNCTNPNAATNINAARVAVCMRGAGKMRRYWKRNDILIKVVARP